MTRTRIGVLGAAGRMGRAVMQAGESAGCVLGAAFERQGAAQIGLDAGEMAAIETRGVQISSDVAATAAEGRFDVLIDFTRPEATLAALDACVSHSIPMVIGTTGFTDQALSAIERAATKIAIVKAGNFSLSVNLCQQLVQTAAAALGASFDIEVVEAHHRHKVDAPSGTALMLGEAAAKGLGTPLGDVAVYERYGHTGERPEGAIGFSTVRGGDVVGDHTVMFLGNGERVEITHKASSRLNFANGAVRAAQWVAGRKPGLYSMQDVLSPD